MPDKIRTFSREVRSNFEGYSDEEVEGRGAKYDAIYSYHFRMGFQKIGGWSAFANLENQLPEEVEGWPIRRDVFTRIVNDFKADLYAKMYNVPLGEAILLVESGMIKDDPFVYQTMNSDGTTTRMTSACENIDAVINK